MWADADNEKSGDMIRGKTGQFGIPDMDDGDDSGDEKAKRRESIASLAASEGDFN